jgi:hypothetical protein
MIVACRPKQVSAVSAALLGCAVPASTPSAVARTTSTITVLSRLAFAVDIIYPFFGG